MPAWNSTARKSPDKSAHSKSPWGPVGEADVIFVAHSAAVGSGAHHEFGAGVAGGMLLGERTLGDYLLDAFTDVHKKRAERAPA